MADEDRYLSLAELVTYSGLSLSALRRAMNAADPLPSYKISGRVLVRKAEFDAWVVRVGSSPATAKARAKGRTFDDKLRDAIESVRR